MAAFRLARSFHALLHRTRFAPRLLEPVVNNHGGLEKRLCLTTTISKRYQSATTADGGVDTTEPEKQKSWFIRWLHGEIPEEPVRTEEEINERRILLEKVQEMYFANPPKSPGVDFYTEAFRLLMKYDDRVGVENLYEVMKEEKIDPGDTFLEEIETYIKKAKERAWLE